MKSERDQWSLSSYREQDMKIGFSLGRCVRDIVSGKVEFDDVLLIVTRTRITKVDEIHNVIREYLWEPTYLAGLDPDACYEVAQKLWDTAKLHQPRLQGVQPHHIAEDYVWMDLVPTASELSDSVLDAWKAYRTMLVLAGGRVPDSPVL